MPPPNQFSIEQINLAAAIEFIREHHSDIETQNHDHLAHPTIRIVVNNNTWVLYSWSDDSGSSVILVRPYKSMLPVPIILDLEHPNSLQSLLNYINQNDSQHT